MNEEFVENALLEYEWDFEQDTEMGDELGPFDNTYFDEPFGVWEENVYEYVYEKPACTYRVPVPSKRIPEPVFGNFVDIRKTVEGTVSC